MAPLAARRVAALRRAPLALLVPSMICLPTAVIAEFVRLSERVMMPIDPTLYLFHRPSEVQELFFYAFVLLYLVLLHRRARRGRGAGAGIGA